MMQTHSHYPREGEGLMSEYTKGTLTVEDFDGEGGIAITMDGYDCFHAVYPEGHGEVEQNDRWNLATLMVAAPDMYEALQLATATIERLNRNNSADGTLHVLAAALAKAEGNLK